MFSAPSCFALQPDEKLEHGFARVLGQIAMQALRLRRHAHGTVAKSIHGTRILIKYLRALLCFTQPTFSPSEIHRAKSDLRRAAHLLSAQRELVVMRSTLKRLSRKTADSEYRKALTRMDNGQQSRQAITEKPEQSLQRAIAILLSTIQRFKRVAKTKSRWPSCFDKLAQAFQDVKTSGKRAVKSEDAARCHDWRKRAKRLLYQLQLTQAVPGRRMRRAIKRVDKLQKMLGDHQDCVIAQERLRKNPPTDVPPLFVRRTLALLEARKTRLRKRARGTASRIRLW